MKKKLATVMAATMAVSGSVVSVSAATTNEQLVGADRADTAVKISKDGWKSAETVILVNDSAIPDALTATPLAYAKNAPILLTAKGGLTKATANEIKRLGAKDVIMIGGDAVLPAKIENDLKALKVKIDRVKGSTREETALAIAKRLDGIKDISEIAVVNGTTGLADAVSVAAAAAEKGMPILLANPKSGLSAVEKFINSESIKSSFVIGGDEAVSDEAIAKLPGKQRIEGSDRNDTNAKVIEKFYADKELDNLYLAKDGMENSGQLIDALAVGALAAKNGAPVLIASKKLSANQVNVVNTKKIATITQVGGKGNEGAFSQLKEIEKAEVIKVKNEAELQEALKKANANDTIEIDANATISKDVTLSTNNAIEINVKGDLTGKVTVKTPNADIKNSGTIGTLVVENGKNTTVTNTSAGKIDKVEVSSSSENVKVENNGTITEVKNDGEGTKVENDGTISKPITGTETPNVEGNKPGGSTGGGGSSSGGGSSAPTYTTGATVDGKHYDTVAEAVTEANKKENSTVKIYGTNELNSQLVISKSMTIVGENNATIKPSNAFNATGDYKDNLLTITANNVSVSGITIENSKGNGLTAYMVSGVKLNNITVKGSAKGGIIINRSTVEAENIKTSGNTWYGINVDKKDAKSTKFTLSGTGTKLEEAIQIFAEKTTNNDELVDWKDNAVHKYLEIAKKEKSDEYYEKGYIYSNRSKEEFKECAVVKPATKEVQVVGNYYKDVKKAIDDASGKTVEIYGEYTIPAKTTVEVKGTVTGTINGTDSTSKLTVSDNGTYGELAKGTYVWMNDSWLLEGTNIIKNGELTLDESKKELSTSFTWSSSEKKGSANGVISNGYNYYTDGVYLRFQVKSENQAKKFNEIFSTKDGVKHEQDGTCGMTLQTNNGKVNDMEGSNREKADWGDLIGKTEEEKTKYFNQYSTKLKNDKKNYIFYGVVQGKDFGGTKTIGFEAGDSRNINMVLRPKADLADGTYTVTVELVQQGENSESLGTINYAFTVKNKVISVK